MANEKLWYESKTLWMNIILVVVGILTAIYESMAAGSAITIVSILNIILRAITNAAVKFQ